MLTRFKGLHPLWGRPLEQYMHHYQVSAAPRSRNGNASRLAAIASAEQIGELSACVDGLGTGDIAKSITIVTLEAILKMAEDEHTYQLFLSPGLIGGCITLMQSMDISGKLPLSYEYGYLCLRVILFALGTYFLQRSQNLKLAKKNMVESHEIELPLVFSSHVSRTIMKLARVPIGSQAKEPSQVPGWGAVESEVALVSPDRIKVLIELLWKDRVNLLRAMMSTYIPALPGLMFMLTRFLNLDPSLAAKQPGQNRDLFRMVSEIHHLCTLWGTKEQRDALDMTMCEIAWSYDQTETATSHKFDLTRVDDSDAQTIFDAYIKRLSLSDVRLYSPINIFSVSIFLGLLALNKGPELEERLPSVLGLTIEALWKAVLAKEKLDELFTGSFLTTLLHIETLLSPTSNKKVDHCVQEKVLASLAKKDLWLKLVDRAIIQMIKSGHLSEIYSIRSSQDIVNTFLKKRFNGASLT
ncbi:unnamed protein product [Rhizoctonia solani]|uniref:Uncharacterized protein n=1 Tax=Rhizoctonia solani TaxID=456999 RepID=A0A8H3BVC9_9AGAM|nr:unnamed protein product [Rhizoctonia solani]